ncbi:class I SAM-dependent methyltransferase [Thalassococcus sp. CAU 1522]|uniref:Class I SAM-dependent methyltransferase n=1 Tax=Thalassococcus arenae TaxID=2851652 RepID=A0ABS6N3Q9_9RHOB|nr:class I SAM-dependent methyltransferase [Thalassococcus arenae]MBV2358660.1 class I SAM-dependent methyltransferase [Thalassococcus arenae]
MTATEAAVAEHYTTGQLFDRVIEALRANGVDPDKATASDLKLGDEFHTGGVLATDNLLEQLTITPDLRVLDVGAGIGGTSRYIADRFGAHVTGVDLTPEFVETARRLSSLVGLDPKTDFHIGSALEMPVPDAGFDLAVMMHVGMNIADKPALLAEVARTLKPGGRFAVFDVMQGDRPGPLQFPVPWSTGPATSFLASPSQYVAAATAAGLTLVRQTDRSDFAKAFFAKALSKPPAAMGIHLMMGNTAPEKFKNYVANLETGRLCPVEMIFDKTR